MWDYRVISRLDRRLPFFRLTVWRSNIKIFCAFNFDMNNMELCPKCKKYYKDVGYPTCIQCLPEDKRKIALEKIESGKAWHAMHQELDID